MPRDYAKVNPSRRQKPVARGHHRSSAGQARAIPVWIWLGLGLLIGIAIAAVAYWKLQGPEGFKSFKSKTARQIESVKVAGNNVSNKSSTTATSLQPAAKRQIPLKANITGTVTDEHAEPTFDFYKILPKMEVEVPTGEGSSNSAGTNTPPVTNTPEKTSTTATATTGQGANSNTVIPREASRYLVQVTALKNYQDADRIKAELLLSGFAAHITTYKTTDNAIWHRVWLGPFYSLSLAQSTQQKLQQQNRPSLIKKIG